MQSSDRPDGEMPLVRNTGGELDLITLLVGFDIQGLVQHIAMIFNAEFNLLGVAGGDTDAAVVGVDTHAGAIRDREGFGVVIRMNSGGKQPGGEKRQYDCRSMDVGSFIKRSHCQSSPDC